MSARGVTMREITRQESLGIDGFTLESLVNDSLDLLREFEPEQGYWGAFSGGKDSVVIKELAAMAGVGVEWHYHVTTIDPPELVHFIKREHPDVKRDRPKENFFTALVRRGFPTRRNRWCCEEYKELRSPPGAVLILGIRGEESKARAARWKEVTFQTKSKNWCVSPILRWRWEHVWGFIGERGLPYCRLYDEGFRRLGCIGCPMAGAAGKRKEFDRWPKYKKLWRRAFRRLWERRCGSAQRDGREWAASVKFSNWEALWDWWLLSDDSFPGGDDQCQLDMWSHSDA